MSRYGASTFSSLLDKCVLWWPGTNVATTIAAKTITKMGGTVITQNTNSSDPWGGENPVLWTTGVYVKPNGTLTFPASSDMVFTGDFTVEFWIKVTGNQLHEWPNIIDNLATSDWGIDQFAITVDRMDIPNVMAVSHYNVSTIPFMVGTTNMIDSLWHHVAVVRYNNTGILYIDGNEEASHSDWTATVSYNKTVNQLIYRSTRSSTTLLGPAYMSNFRISNIARYTGEFTVPSGPFVNDVYTKLLLKMDGSGTTFVDSSGYVDCDCFPIIPSGVTPTNNGVWDKSDLGNSKLLLNFTSSNQNYLALSDDDAWFFGTGDFTVSFWLKFNTALPSSTVSFISQNGGSAVVSPVELVFYHNGNNKLYVQSGSSTSAWDIINAWAASGTKIDWAINTWYYITLVRSGTSVKVYVDNVQDISVTIAANANFFNSTSTLDILRYQNNTNNWLNGNMKDLMIFKDRALTQPEIELLMNRTHPITGAGLLDSGRYYKLS